MEATAIDLNQPSKKFVNWEAVGAAGEVFGAIAVVATLGYLARQIRQSANAARASHNRSLQQAFEGINDLVLANPALAETLRAIENPERSRGRSDGVLLRHLSYRWLNVWLSAQTSYTNGQLSAREFEFFKDDVRNVLDTYPGLTPYIVEELRRYPSAIDWEIFEPFSAHL